jgi:hypothetical protein
MTRDLQQPSIPIERIQSRILLLRGQKVILDRDLAELYEVSVGALNQAMKRNADRFPEDFAFQLTWDETEALKRSQFVIAKRGENPKFRPRAFSEQGVAMLSSVLRSRRAIHVNIAIMRVFVRIREVVASNAELARRLDAIERQIVDHDTHFKIVFEAIRELMDPSERGGEGEKIGFRAPSPKSGSP